MEYKYVKFEVFIPAEYVETLRNKLNDAGACSLGKYDNCISFSLVEGYWRPLEGSNPYKGKVNYVESGKEGKVEFICEKKYINNVVEVIREIHPYEEPMYYIVPIINDQYDEQFGK
ncbi:MAG: cytochrome C biogenesis protein [Thermotogota bacterium]|nr:cytochrome C biogenesis protein [Thermotogota bacterium]